METFVSPTVQPITFAEYDTPELEKKKEFEEPRPSKDDWLAYLGGVLTFGAIIPQIVHVWRAKSADDLSYTFMLMTFIGVSFLLLHALINGLKVHIWNNMFFLAFYLVLIFLKFRYGKH